MQIAANSAAASSVRSSQVGAVVETQLDPWAALIAAASSPDDWIVIERDGDLVIEPAPVRQ